MIELTNSVAQTVAPGATVTFDKVVLHTGCGECHDRRIPNSVKLTGNGGVYLVEFNGNIASPTAATPVQLAIAFGGTALPETVMVSTASAANAFNNVGTGTLLHNSCCDCDRITVVNSGAVPVLLSANMNLRITRRA